MSEPHVTHVIRKYSDGTETVVEFKPLGNAAEIEAAVAASKAEYETPAEPVEETVAEVTEEVEAVVDAD